MRILIFLHLILTATVMSFAQNVPINFEPGGQWRQLDLGGF
jgi:hypothetical protein